MLRLVALCVVRCRSSSCVAFGLFVVVCRLALICALRCVALVAGHDCVRGFVASICANAHSIYYLYYYYNRNF